MMKIRNSVLAVFAFALVTAVSAGFVSSAESLSFEDQFLSDAELAAPTSGTYSFDPAHSAIGFKVTHMGLVHVPGYFTKFDGTVNFNAEDVAKSTVEFSADVASVDTRVERRDNHLRSADFFDVEKFPKMTFKSTKVVADGDNLKVMGNLTMKDKTVPVELSMKVVGFKEARGGSKIMGAMGKTKIQRSKFGITYGIETGAISDEVEIEINVEARGAGK